MISPKLAIAGAVLAASVLGGFAAGWVWNGALWSAKYSELQRGYAETAQIAQAQARATEQKYQTYIDEARTDGQEKIAKVVADAAADVVVADRVRAERTDRTRRATENTCTTDGGAAARSTLLLYSELLDKADQRQTDLARESDLRRAAGLTCERAYDAIQKGATQ